MFLVLKDIIMIIIIVNKSFPAVLDEHEILFRKENI